MADKKKNKSKSSDELIDIKSLIGNADGGGFTVDGILSEFEDPLDLPWPQAPTTREPHGSNVVIFPGRPAESEAEASQKPRKKPKPDASKKSRERLEPDAGKKPRKKPEPFPMTEFSPSDLSHTGESSVPPDNVIEFPEEESLLTSFLKDLKQRADNYTEQMIEATQTEDLEEIRRLEKLIPGTDQETPRPEKQRRPLHIRIPRKPEELPEDTPPYDLSQQCKKSLKFTRFRLTLLFLVTALALVLTIAPLLGLPWLLSLIEYRAQVLFLAVLLCLGLLLSVDILSPAVTGIIKGKLGMEALALFAGLFTAADALMLSAAQNRQGQLPYCGVVLVALLLLGRGRYHKMRAVQLSCRMAATASTPYRVTLDENKWDGKNAYSKWMGESTGFGSQIQADDGAQRIYRVVCPLLLLGCVLFSLLASVGQGKGYLLLWCLSATFTVSCALGGTLCYGRAFRKIAQRLSKNGSALAGWPGVAGARRGSRVLVTDHDLFPPGYVKSNGSKVLSDRYVKHPETVLAYTATLLEASGSVLGPIFHDEVRKVGGLMRRIEGLKRYEGGLSGTIRGSQVLVGSAAFMTLMEIPIPKDANVKNKIFSAIDGELTGVFVVEYRLPDQAYPALTSLIRERVIPVLATRDFNIIPDMLRQRFKLDVNRMDFPPVSRREELSDPAQSHSSTLTAVLCLEGVAPFAEAILGAQRLRRCTRVGAVLCCISSLIGILLCSYLTGIEAYTSLSAQNLLVYLLAWLVPIWLLTDWAAGY